MATRIVLKNSVEAGKVPLISDLVPGELALNLTDKKLYSKTPGGEDAEVFEIGSGRVNGGTTPPASGDGIGDLFFDTTTNQLLYWNGSAWEPIEAVMSLNDLTDVEVSGVTDKQVLVYNATNSQWEAVSATTLVVDVDLGYTAAVNQGTVTNSSGDNAVIPAVASDKAGLMTPTQLTKLDNIPSDLGSPLWEQDSGVLSPKTSSDSVRIGGDQAAPHIALNSTGYSTFKGDVLIGDESTYSSLSALLNSLPTYVADGFRNELRELDVDTADLLEQPIDEAFAQLPVDLVRSILRETPTGNINLSADGSASFAGRVAGSRLDVNNSTTNANDVVFSVNTGSPERTVHRIKADGTAQIGDIDGTADTANIELNADGSATFAGNIFGEKAIASSRFNVTTQLASEETVETTPGNPETRQYAFIAKNADSIYRVALDYSGNLALGNDAWRTPNIYLKGSDGSATFAGDVTAPNVTFNLEPENPDNYITTTEEYTETEYYTVEIPVIERPGVGTADIQDGVSTPDLVDGDERKTQTITKSREVTKTREVKTYTGPTLDVKTELLALRERAAQQDAAIDQLTTQLAALQAKS